jgi:hypothetical protein
VLLAMQRALAAALTHDDNLAGWEYRQEMVGWQQMQCREGYTGPLCGTCMPPVSRNIYSAAAAAGGGGGGISDAITASPSEHALRGYGRLSFRCVACRPFAMEVSVLVVLFIVQCMYLSLGILLQLRAPKRFLNRRGDTLRSYRRDVRVAAGAASGAWSTGSSMFGRYGRRRGSSSCPLGGFAVDDSVNGQWRGGSVEGAAYSDGSWAASMQENGELYSVSHGRGGTWGSRSSPSNELIGEELGVTGAQGMVSGEVFVQRRELELAERRWEREGRAGAGVDDGMRWRPDLSSCQPLPLLIPQFQQDLEAEDGHVGISAQSGCAADARPLAFEGGESSPLGTGTPRSLPELPETPLMGRSSSLMPSSLATSQGEATSGGAAAAAGSPFAVPAAAAAALAAADGLVSASHGLSLLAELPSAPTLADGVPTSAHPAEGLHGYSSVAWDAPAAADANPWFADADEVVQLKPVISIQIAKGGLSDSAGEEPGATFWPCGPPTPFVDSAPDTPFASGFLQSCPPDAPHAAPSDSPFVDTGPAFDALDEPPCSSPFAQDGPSADPSLADGTSIKASLCSAGSLRISGPSQAQYGVSPNRSTRLSNAGVQGGFMGLRGVPHTIWEERSVAAFSASEGEGVAAVAYPRAHEPPASSPLPEISTEEPSTVPPRQHLGQLRQRVTKEELCSFEACGRMENGGAQYLSMDPRAAGQTALCKDTLYRDVWCKPSGAVGEELGGGHTAYGDHQGAGDGAGLAPGALQQIAGSGQQQQQTAPVVLQKMSAAGTLVGIWKILTNYLQVWQRWHNSTWPWCCSLWCH